MEDQQEEDDYQKPDKFQKISNMVFLNGVQWFLRFNTKGVDVVYMTYVDACVTPYKIWTRTCLRARWAKKIRMIILSVIIFIDRQPL